MSPRGRLPAARRELAANLVRVGSWTTAPRGVNALGAALALLAFLSISLGLFSAIVAGATYAHRADVSRARTPVVVEAGTAQPPALFWRFVGDAVDDRPVGLYALQPLTRDAPLPPGVARWLAPGEAVVSPALRALLASHGTPDRYGRDVGQIERDGLASDTELLVYAHLPVPLSEEQGAWPVASFGVSATAPFLPVGEVLYDRSVVEFWTLAAFLMMLPGVVALVAAARVADEETRRRHVLLARLGAGRRARAMVALPRVLPPCLVSLALSLGLLTAASTVDLAIPFKGNVVEAAVVRGAAGRLAVAVLLAHAAGAAVLALLTASRQGRLGATRLLAPRDRPAWARTALLLAVLAVQPWVVARADNQVVLSFSTLAAAGVAVVCLPAAVATLLQATAARRARRSLDTRRTGRFLGWRVTHHRSHALSRLAASLCALVVVVGHGAAVLALFTGPELEARRTTERIGTSLLVASPGPVPLEPGAIERFATRRGLAAVQARRARAGAALTLAGSCTDLQVLGAGCRDGPLDAAAATPRLQEVLRWYAGEVSTRVAVADTPTVPDGDGHAADVLLLSRDGADLDRLALARDAYASGLVVRVERLGEGWIVGAVDLLHKSYWILVFGVPGVLTLLIVSALTWVAVVVEESAALVRSPLLAERPDVFGAVAAVRVAVPVLAGGLGGTAVTAWLLAAHARIGSARVPTGFLASVAVATVAVAVLSSLVATRVMVAASRKRWERA